MEAIITNPKESSFPGKAQFHVAEYFAAKDYIKHLIENAIRSCYGKRMGQKRSLRITLEKAKEYEALKERKAQAWAYRIIRLQAGFIPDDRWLIDSIKGNLNHEAVAKELSDKYKSVNDRVYFIESNALPGTSQKDRIRFAFILDSPVVHQVQYSRALKALL